MRECIISKAVRKKGQKQEVKHFQELQRLWLNNGVRYEFSFEEIRQFVNMPVLSGLYGDKIYLCYRINTGRNDIINLPKPTCYGELVGEREEIYE